MQLDSQEQGTPADWLRYARADLAMAGLASVPGVLPEMLCFHAQQAAEKAVKAVLVQQVIPFPRTHNIQVLLELLLPTWPVPQEVAMAAGLSDYAVAGRYPGEFEQLTDEDYQEAVHLAEAVVAWAEGIIGG